MVQQARTAIWLYLDEKISDIPFMSAQCRDLLDAEKRPLVARARPDLTPRFRDGLKDKAA